MIFAFLLFLLYVILAGVCWVGASDYVKFTAQKIKPPLTFLKN